MRSGVNPNIVHKLVMIAFSVVCNELPDYLGRGIFTPDQEVGNRLNPAVELLTDHFVVVLNNKRPTHILDVDRHTLAVGAWVRPADRCAFDAGVQLMYSSSSTLKSHR